MPEDSQTLTNEIIEKNIVEENVEYISGRIKLDEENFITSANQQLHVDGKIHEVSCIKRDATYMGMLMSFPKHPK